MCLRHPLITLSNQKNCRSLVPAVFLILFIDKLIILVYKLIQIDKQINSKEIPLAPFFGHPVTRFGMMNCYLVEDQDGLTLIDTGMAGSADLILKAAARLEQPIRRLMLTHAHTDHVGSVDDLVQRVPDLEFLCSSQTARFLQGAMALTPGQPDVPVKGGFVPVTAVPTRILSPGDRIGWLTVLAAPGHSPDHLVFLDNRDGTLYAGDAFQTRGGLAVSGDLRWRFPLPAWATWHKPTALETARALADLAPTRLAVGHGPVLVEPVDAMRVAIARAEKKFQ